MSARAATRVKAWADLTAALRKLVHGSRTESRGRQVRSALPRLGWASVAFEPGQARRAAAPDAESRTTKALDLTFRPRKGGDGERRLG